MPTIEDKRLRELVRTHSRSLLRYLARSGVPQADLDDALQEVFVVTAAKLAQVPAESERAFLFGSAHRVAGNARRGQRRRVHAQDQMIHTAWDSSPDVEDLTDRLRAREMLEEVLEHLPEDVQLVFRLFEIDGEPIAEISERLGLSHATIASRLRRGRAALHRFCTRESLGRAARAHAARGNGTDHPEVLSWWGSGGEADALRALTEMYQCTHPNQLVVRATVDSAGQAKRALKMRMEFGALPDTFLVNGGADLYGWVRRVRRAMDPIDFLFESEGWKSALPSDLIDLVTYSGRAYAVPMNVHRTNTLFYNKRVLAKLGVPPPATLEELHAVIDLARAHRIVPLALGWRDPWTLTHVAFENVMIAVAGGDYYREFFDGARSPRDSEMRDVLAELARLVSASNEGGAMLSWQDAADLLGSGQAALMLMGDWAKAYLASNGWSIDDDFGQVPMPGTRGSFVFATDTFGLPKHANGRSPVIDLLKIFGSETGQATFNLIKGSIPARQDVDLSSYDALAQATARDFAESVRYPSVASLAPASFLRVADQALAQFAIAGDAGACVASLREHYGWLRSRVC